MAIPFSFGYTGSEASRPDWELSASNEFHGRWHDMHVPVYNFRGRLTSIRTCIQATETQVGVWQDMQRQKWLIAIYLQNLHAKPAKETAVDAELSVRISFFVACCWSPLASISLSPTSSAPATCRSRESLSPSRAPIPVVFVMLVCSLKLMKWSGNPSLNSHSLWKSSDESDCNTLDWQDATDASTKFEVFVSCFRMLPFVGLTIVRNVYVKVQVFVDSTCARKDNEREWDN